MLELSIFKVILFSPPLHLFSLLSARSVPIHPWIAFSACEMPHSSEHTPCIPHPFYFPGWLWRNDRFLCRTRQTWTTETSEGQHDAKSALSCLGAGSSCTFNKRWCSSADWCFYSFPVKLKCLGLSEAPEMPQQILWSQKSSPSSVSD